MTYALGFDVGCTNIKAIAVGADGGGIDKRSLPTPTGAPALSATVSGLIRDWEAERQEPPSAIGVAAPGLAGADGRAIVWMEGRNIGVVDLDWSAALGRRVWVLNDGHAATLGEGWLGAAAGAANVVLLTLGTGVGGGILIGGELLKGEIGRAGHLGHLCLDPDGEPDICRTPGSLEMAIGDVTLESRSGGRFTSTEQLVAAAQSGDDEAERLWRTAVRSLACAVASLINVLDPEVVVIGGGIAAAGEALFAPLRSELDEVEWRPTGTPARVVPAALGGVAGAIGSARYAMQRDG